eukprot:648025-Pleurochrysis_carterae.AAC.1
MAASARLREGDVVSLPVCTFGEQYARSRGAVQWTSASVRNEGRVVGKRVTKWIVEFDDLDEPAVLPRKAYRVCPPC